MLFHFQGARLAVEASAVLEVALLPELVGLGEAGDRLVGVVNFRGRIVPVIDLARSFGQAGSLPVVTDTLLVIEHESAAVGIVVQKVLGVEEVFPEQVAPLPEQDERFPARALSGLLRLADGIVPVLNLGQLTALDAEDPGSGLSESASAASSASLWTHFAPAEEIVLKERADALALRTESSEREGLAPFALARLGGEWFGIALGSVREFAPMREVARVPCCPPTVLGQMNLRGDMVTVLDVSQALGLAAREAPVEGPVVVVDGDGHPAGIAVDELQEVVFLPPPNTRVDGAEGPGHLLGAAQCGDRMLTLLDLPALLKQPQFVVNEEP